ncbi:hypothetical protein KXW27_001596 [Aspergillus fumigatus]|nr:hypothetical protein KXW27_001596 [Aspergillus fumigatus]
MVVAHPRRDRNPQIRDKDGTLFAKPEVSIAREEPGAENDAAWGQYEKILTHVVTRDQILKLGKDPETVARFDNDYWGMGDDAYMVQMDVMHQIHCLNLLRKAAFADYPGYEPELDEKDKMWWIHLGHCTDILLQNIQCNANTEFLTLNWVEDRQAPWPDFSVNRKCRDFNALLDWQHSNAVDPDKFDRMPVPKDAFVWPAPWKKQETELGEKLGQHHMQEGHVVPPDDGHRLSDEDAPFLLEDFRSQPEPGDESSGDSSPDTTPPEQSRCWPVIALVAIMLTFEIGGQMIPGPMVRIIEIIVCEGYWRAHDPSRLPASGHVADHLCKIEEVQAEVTTIKGYLDFLEGLLCVLCAIPYGFLADRYGRRQAIRLTIPGFLLNAIITNSVLWFSDIFPPRAIWLAALSWTIGGGPIVAMALLWTMLADYTTDSTRPILFFRIGVVSEIATFLAGAISAQIMALNPWIPTLMGCGIVAVGLTCAFFLPETLNHCAKKKATIHRDEPVSCMGGLIVGEESFYCSPKVLLKSSRHCLILGKIRRFLNHDIFIFDHRLMLLLFAFAVYGLAQGSSGFLAQYMSTRFNWTLAQANLLKSFHTAATLPVFLFLLPYLSTHVLNYLSLRGRDLYLARMSITCLAVGSLSVGLAPNIVFLVPSLCLHAAGGGFPLVARSLATALVESDKTARLNSTIEILHSMGSVLGSLCFTKVFTLGLKLCGVWIGLVWIMSSLLFALVGIPLTVLRV